MRPFLLFRPGGDVPEAIRSPLEKAGTEVLVAGTLEEAGTLLCSSMPDVLLVVSPGTAADAAMVSRVAALAALDLADAERDALAGQLTRIVEHFEALRAVPEALLHCGETPPPAMPLRADVARDGSPGPLVEENAPEFAHGHFVVPRVVTRDA